MGQYYVLVNKTKKEIVRPHDVDDGAKFMEMVNGNTAGILMFLVCQSDENGGGDGNRNLSLRGSWAGDNITLVGDYDSSKLYQEVRESPEYENISALAFEQYNEL